MIYKIIRNRGVLQSGEPFLLDEKKPFSLIFDGLPTGRYIVSLKRQRSTDKEIIVEAKERVDIDVYNLKVGVYNVELRRIDGTAVTDKIICTPIQVLSLAAMSNGFIAYPETDAMIERLAELEKEVAELLAWKEDVKEKIHEHKVIL